MSLAIPPLLSIPLDVLSEIMYFSLEIRDGDLEGRLVCKKMRDALDHQMSKLWDELKRQPPTGAINFRKLMDEVEQDPVAQRSPRVESFKKLTRLITKLHSIRFETPRFGVLPAQFAELQQKLVDASLITIWQKIKLTSLPYLSSAAEIRFFINDQANEVKLNAIITLDLNSLNLRVIPNEICKFTQLKNLYLSHNHLWKIPQLNALTQLQRLSLSNNHFIEVPDLKDLPQLTELYLYSNDFTSIPSLGTLTQLKELYL